MKISFNNTHSGIEFDSPGEKHRFTMSVLPHLSIYAPGYKYMEAYKMWKKTKGAAGWNGKVNLAKDWVFLTGMLPKVEDLIFSKMGDTPVLVDERPFFKPKFESISIELRSYQLEAVTSGSSVIYNSLWWPRGILAIATGGGKTRIAAAQYQFCPVPSLFIVHKKHLLHQTVDSFKEHGISAGIIGDGIFHPNPTGITVSTIQTLHSKYVKRRTEELKFLLKIQQVFFDEAHLISASVKTGNTFVQVAGLLKNAYMRWGLTATPFMKDIYSNWLLLGVTGETIYEKSNSELIREGFLAPPEIHIYEPRKVMKCSRQWPECYDEGIILNSSRNDLIVDILKTLPKPCIIMCNQIAHAQIIQSRILKSGMNVEFVQGKNDSESRKEIINKLRENKLDQIVTTTIFDEGLDIPELKSLVLAGAGKSTSKMLQRIGRGLRTAEGKQKLILVDFNDTSTRILKSHSKKRREIWENEGFTIVKKSIGK